MYVFEPLSPFSRNMTEMMTTVSLQIVGIIEPIIQHADWFFPGGQMYMNTGGTITKSQGNIDLPLQLFGVIVSS